MSLIDSHCHLDLETFDSDRELIIGRAQNAGVAYFIDPGIDLLSSEKSIQLSRIFPNFYCAVGVHPNEAHTWDSSSVMKLRTLVGNLKVIAIGEIGLDYYRNSENHDLQLSILRIQLELAADIGLPVIIHNRNSSDDMLHILSDWHEKLLAKNSKQLLHPGVLHSFEGDQLFASKLLEMNFCIGINGIITFPNASRLREIVMEVPIERILIETDAPFLAPQPQRGKRNEPAYIQHVVEKIADVKRLSFETVATTTSRNAASLFSMEL